VRPSSPRAVAQHASSEPSAMGGAWRPELTLGSIVRCGLEQSRVSKMQNSLPSGHAVLDFLDGL
jgi:hypothetical protein